MPLEPRISFRGMEMSEALEQKIRGRIADLEQIYDRITGCGVVVESRHKHPSGGRSFHVAIDMAVPGKNIAVRRDPAANHGHEDAYIAVHEAFDAARRQLEDHVRIMRGDVKTHRSAQAGEGG
jgi:ribosome-associated translation inhibitor RaiA